MRKKYRRSLQVFQLLYMLATTKRKKTSVVLYLILCSADTAAILILPPGHPITIIEIDIFFCEQLISMIIMGCPGGKINMAAISAKRSIVNVVNRDVCN